MLKEDDSNVDNNYLANSECTLNSYNVVEYELKESARFDKAVNNIYCNELNKLMQSEAESPKSYERKNCKGWNKD